MEKEFNLSEKIYAHFNKDGTKIEYYFFKGKDIKEFIKRLKHGLKYGIKGASHLSEPELIRNEWKIIDKLAGDNLK